MSKTIRRKRENRWGIKWALKEPRLIQKYPKLSHSDAMKAELACYHADGSWNMTTPSWWIRLCMTAPQRAIVRTELKNIMKSDISVLDELDYTVFPLAKKPHLYYW